MNKSIEREHARLLSPPTPSVTGRYSIRNGAVRGGTRNPRPPASVLGAASAAEIGWSGTDGIKQRRGCGKCSTAAMVMMDDCMTCLNCSDSKCGSPLGCRRRRRSAASSQRESAGGLADCY